MPKTDASIAVFNDDLTPITVRMTRGQARIVQNILRYVCAGECLSFTSKADPEIHGEVLGFDTNEALEIVEILNPSASRREFVDE